MNSLDNDSDKLLEQLRSLETELHQDETRRNRKRMDMLLHRDFVEFGRSGKRYSRADVLEEFGAGSALPAVEARHFDLVVLGEGAALLRYVSAHRNGNGDPERPTLRSSVWVRTAAGWQIRFHQGTPTTQAALDGL